MAFRHGVYKREVPTSIIAPAQSEAGLPVIIGTAPVFMSDKECVNIPKLVYTYEEAVKIFGYSSDWANYTLCEFIYSQFALFGQSPAVLINVFDPEAHKQVITNDGEGETYLAVDGRVSLGPGVMSADDYELLYDDEGNAYISTSAAGIKIKTITKAKPELVTPNDIIGGVNAQSGKYTGLEIVNQIFPKFRLIPGLIGAPGWSENSSVAAVMRAKADNISGVFTGLCIVDIPCGSNGAKVYTDAPNWKNTHNFTAERMIACWPKIALDGKVFHMSTQLIGLMNKVDAAHSDIPYKSPSNESLQMDSCVDDAGEEVTLTLEQANYLNGQGITTALNWSGGWKSWGNRTAAYPANTDTKDCFISVRRMFDFIGNQFILTFWQKVDQPMTPRLVRAVVNTFNMYMNSLVAIEALLGGRIEFREDENSITELLDGKMSFHLFITPPSPAEVIESVLEYDPEYLSVLYEAVRN